MSEEVLQPRITLPLLRDDAPEAEAVVAIELLAFARTQMREQLQLLEQSIVEWLLQTGKEPVIGDKRYYPGKVKSYRKRTELQQIADAALEATGGDWEAFAGLLSSNAFKYGALRDALGEEGFAELYEVVVKDDMKTGKPKRKVAAAWVSHDS